jgi:ABC-type phosphate/phosphonate transport system substrate-binding protein
VSLLLALCLPLLTSADTKDRKAKEIPAIKVRIYSSVLAGYDENEAKAGTEPMLKILARQIDFPMELDIDKGTTREDFLAFGRNIADGVYHLGVVWGIEYGWLVQEHPELRVLAVCAPKKVANFLRYEVLVRRSDRFADLKNLKGKKLARYNGEGLLSKLILNDTLKKNNLDPKDFFLMNKPVRTARSAIDSVLDGDADCVFVEGSHYWKLKELRPTLSEDLAVLCESEDCPVSAVIGSPDTFKKLRPGLWDQFQDALLAIHKTPEGEETIKYWRIEAFTKPDDAFHDGIKKWVRRIPISSLPSRK